jgi:sugar phosphate isomerase/epimerase
MKTTRRKFLSTGAGAVAGVALSAGSARAVEGKPKLRLSACDWSLRVRGDVKAVQVAKTVGLDGLEISTGDAADTLAIASPELRQQYKAAMTDTGIVASSVAMGLLNNYPLASDPRGPAWLEQTIAATADLGAKVTLLAFFGKGDLLTKAKQLRTGDVDVVVGRLKEAAVQAEKAGVILGLENTLSGRDNAAIIERVGSSAVQVYYDVGNSTYNRYDVPAEIRDLKDLICQFHFKDGKYFLGEGRVDMKAVAEAIHTIDYEGWIVLETSLPSKDRDADFKRNAAFVRDLMGMT